VLVLNECFIVSFKFTIAGKLLLCCSYIFQLFRVTSYPVDKLRVQFRLRGGKPYMEMPSHVCTLVRKTAVSAVHQKRPEMKGNLADLMCHTVDTAERGYRLVEREQTSASGARWNFVSC